MFNPTPIARKLWGRIRKESSAVAILDIEEALMRAFKQGESNMLNTACEAIARAEGK